jgi:hypothetical protein
MSDADLLDALTRHGWNVSATQRALGKESSGALQRRLTALRGKHMPKVERAPIVAPVAHQEPETCPNPAESFGQPDVPAWQGYRPRAGWSEPEKSRPAKATKERVIRTVVLADVHVPYHSRLAWGCALGIVRDAKPDRVVINGDFIEMEALSRHPKSRPDLTRLAEELYAGNVALDELQQAAGSAEVVYVEGNHEGRAPRYAAEFGQLDGLLSVPVGLYLEPRADYHRETNQLRGIRWVPLKMQPFTVGAVGFLHGVFESMYHAAMTAQHLGPKCGVRHLVTAHMHGWQSFASPSGFTAYACPWLGDETAHVFRAYVKGRPRPWHLGVLAIEEAGEDVNVTPVFIRNGRALVGGRVVVAA